jgi:hypothetical protein
MPKLTAYVANLLIGGHEVTHLPNDSWVRDIIRFNCNGRVLLFRQNLDVVTGKLKSPIGDFCETTTVEVENVSPDELSNTLQTINSVCLLLSFVTQSRVIYYGHDYSTGTSLGQRNAAAGVANHFRPVFDFNDSEKIINFIEETYSTYISLAENRKLYVVFEYLYQAERATQPLEIRLLLLFITLESLKATYADSTGLTFDGSYYRKPPVNGKKKGAIYNFVELLSEMLHSVEMSFEFKPIKELRDEIIHSGLSHKSHSEQIQMYEEVLDLLREYILRLLKYRGEYQTYSMQTQTI